ncbi:MAG: acyl-CoA dehydrogenase [Rhodospirillaceae bacterium]|nr:MAG: acyl-CoA dehydrogenase [Rhodospirillaceae bacterium]
MDFTLNADQATLATAIDSLAARFETVPTNYDGFTLFGRDLEQELENGEFFDIALVPELGPLSAALAVERLSRLPYTAEFALSMLFRPHLSGEWPRPIAIVENGRPGRFVATAKTILVIDGENVGITQPSPDEIEPVESIFAYPMGRLKTGVTITPLPASEAAIVRKWIRVALAAEASGLLHTAIAMTVEYLTVRHQFGRPLGTFQALQHRLAECTVLAGGVRWLALRAAWTADDGDAALAALHAQESATRVIYDVHQMHGGIGVTLEYPLHLWTYRLKALISELGGRGGQASAVAQHCFGSASSY